MNCDEFVTDPSGGEAVSSSDGCQIVESAKSRVLPGKQPQKKANATTRIHIHRGSFTAGFLLEPATTTRNQEYVAESRDCNLSAKPNRAPFRSCDLRPPIPNSNAGHNNSCFSIIQAISSIFVSISLGGTTCDGAPAGPCPVKSFLIALAANAAK